MNNFFEFFDIPMAFNIDQDQLRSRYIENNRKFHPDFHTLANSEQQDRVLELSTINNQGWKTLSNRQKRIAHILELNGAMPEEGKATVPQEFLMEMMDINEALMELEFDSDENKKSEVINALEELTHSLDDIGNTAMAKWDANQDHQILNEVRDFFLKMKYINRIKERLN